MRARLLFFAWVSLAGASAAGAQAPSAPVSVSIVEYLAALDRLALSVDGLDERHADRVADVLRTVPPDWQVTSADKSWTIPAAWLRRDLDAWRRKPDAAARAATVSRLRLARSQAAAYESAATDASPARAALTGILARPEFRDLAGPSWLDRLRERVLRWVVQLLSRFVGLSALPTITNVAVYVLIGAAVLVVALWMRRALRRGAVRDEALLDLHTAAARPWNDWLTDARAASAAGDWRQAIRLAYWCGIVYLEARGAWRPDPSRTPREYLRALSPAGEHEPALRSLTGLLERVWYGTAVADAARFEEALAHLRTLGCPLP